MFVIPGLVALIVFMLGRPFDLIESLRGLPLLYVFCGLAILGYAVDLKLRFVEFRASRHLLWVMLFMGWALVTVALRAPEEILSSATALAIVLIVYLLLAHGINTFKGFELIAATILMCALWIGLCMAHLGLQPTACLAFSPGESPATAAGRPTGALCEMAFQCSGGAEDANGYACEHVGWFELTSITQRVRYVGTLRDPNEVAMLVAVATPFSVAFYQRRRTLLRALLLLVTVVLALMTVRFSQSRGGLLVMLTVFAVYSVQRFGLKRTLQIGLPLSVPLLLLFMGGEREDGEASTYKRLGCMKAGLDMLFNWPVFGAGFGQFGKHHTQTAHNSYLLAAGELGIFGMLLWTTILYLSVKTMIVATLRCKSDEARVARIWGTAVSTSLAGLSVGNFFLSFTYHNVIWIFFGLSAAFFGAIQYHNRRWRVPLSWRDGLIIVGGNTILIFAVLAYTAAKL